MKIAVTSQNFRTVTGHAGRARRFIVFDAQPGAEPIEIDRLDLPKELAMHDFHSAGPHPVDGVDVILSEGFGEGFAQRMAKRGIIAATTAETDPIESVRGFMALLEAGGDVPTAATCGYGHGHHHAQGAGVEEEKRNE